MDNQLKRDSDTGLSDLPVDCLVKVISLTSPKDACRLSVAATWLRSAVESDQVWEKILPPDYRQILSLSAESGTELCSMPKRQLYFHLCHNPVLISRSKCFSLDKPTGKKNFGLSAHSLLIECSKFWKSVSWQGSRFGSAVEQITTDIKIQGTIDPGILSAGTKYMVYLVFRTFYSGMPLLSAEVLIGYVDRKRQLSRWRKAGIVDLHPSGAVKREDGWLEVELGEVFIDGKEDDADVAVLLQPATGRRQWRRGGYFIVIEGMDFRVASESGLNLLDN